MLTHTRVIIELENTGYWQRKNSRIGLICIECARERKCQLLDWKRQREWEWVNEWKSDDRFGLRVLTEWSQNVNFILGFLTLVQRRQRKRNRTGYGYLCSRSTPSQHVFYLVMRHIECFIAHYLPILWKCCCDGQREYSFRCVSLCHRLCIIFLLGCLSVP